MLLSHLINVKENIKQVVIALVFFNRSGVARAVLQTPLSLINRPGVAGAVL